MCEHVGVSLTALRDQAVESYAEGREWGAGGSYEWVSAVADFTVDPDAAANAGITDLHLASRQRGGGKQGLVTFDADLRVLRPQNGGNGRLLFVVPNRGMLGSVPFCADAPFAFGPSERLDAGDGFLLEAGWTIAWGGWQWDVIRQPGSLGLIAPVADVQPGWLRVEFRPDTPMADHSLSDSSALFQFQAYPTADLADPAAMLTEQLTPDGTPTLISRERWHFADSSTVVLDGGFQPFHWYTLTYRSSFAPVTGTGLLAVRDTVSWLRREYGCTTAFGYGVSQSGRFLRQFLYEGRNLDEGGSAVFDGVFAHIAGGRRGEFNHRHAQPSLTHPLGFSNLPPYDSARLLAPARAAGGAPKVILTNSSWEYWRGDGALVHADPETGQDLPEDPDVRAFLLSGTDHLGAVAAFKDLMPRANPTHNHDIGPILRALFVVLTEWVCAGEQPPDSRVPRVADGTATERAAVLEQFSALAEVALPDLDALNVTRDIDLGPGAADGIGTWPFTLGAAKPALVSTVDESGNEVAGIALPLVAVPVAAYTGWNPRIHVAGLPTPLYEFVGSKLAMLASARRLGRDEYEGAVRTAAARLVAERFLLAVDVERTVREALGSYDASASAPASPHVTDSRH